MYVMREQFLRSLREQFLHAKLNNALEFAPLSKPYVCSSERRPVLELGVLVISETSNEHMDQLAPRH